MIKQMAWNTFKNTGNIDTFLEFVQVKNIEDKINNNLMNGEVDGNNQDKRNYNFRK